MRTPPFPVFLFLLPFVISRTGQPMGSGRAW
jgi:hypothetical protein